MKKNLKKCFKSDKCSLSLNIINIINRDSKKKSDFFHRYLSNYIHLHYE